MKWPGAAHDARIFENSCLKGIMEKGTVMANGVIVTKNCSHQSALKFGILKKSTIITGLN